MPLSRGSSVGDGRSEPRTPRPRAVSPNPRGHTRSHASSAMRSLKISTHQRRSPQRSMTRDDAEGTDNEPTDAAGHEPASEPANNAAATPAAGPNETGTPPPQQFGDQDGARRRRRGRRGRGGGGAGFGGPRPPYAGPRPQFGGSRPQFGAPPFRPQPFVPREESEQARELAGYERRQAQRQRGPMGWRGGAGGPGPAPQGGGQWRPRRGGEQRYSDAIRRVTAGPP